MNLLLTVEHSDNEASILSQCAKGDLKAFNVLFLNYYEQVYGLSLIMCKSPEQAEDLTQEIFTKIWEKKEALAEIRKFRPYLNTVTRNHVRDYLRKKVLVPANAGYLEAFFSESGNKVENEFLAKELQTHLHNAIERLTPQAREVFILSRLELLTHRQIAEKLNISETTSKSHIVKALSDIRKYLRTYYPHLFRTLLVLL